MHQVSLPPSDVVPVSLDALAGTVGAGGSLERFLCSKVLPRSQDEQKLKECVVKEPYTDPKIKGHEYAKFVQRLHARGLIDFSLDKKQLSSFAFRV